MLNLVNSILNKIHLLPLWANYIFFFLSAVLQAVFPPYPGDGIIIFAGYIKSTGIIERGISLFIPYFLGTIITSFVVYELGIKYGDKILSFKFVRKYFPGKKQIKTKKWVSKHGILALLVCKFIPGVNALIIFFEGMLHYKRILAYPAIIVSSFIENYVLYISGMLIGHNWPKIIKFLESYGHGFTYVMIIAVLIYLRYRIWVKKTSKSKVIKN